MQHRYVCAALILGIACVLAGCADGGNTPTSIRATPAPHAAADAAPLDVTSKSSIVSPGPASRSVAADASVDSSSRSAARVRGVLTFRGNERRTFHGTGPVGAAAEIAWSYPQRAMCGKSSEYGEVRTWCGTGWVGQPVVFERAGRTWLAFGAYDHQFHFLDAVTGEALLEPLPTGDIAKGMLTVDPDGYPLLYGGSRDNLFRVIAIDGGKAEVLWSLDARSFAERKWNNDWDSAALLVRGHLVITGENGRIHVVRLNRSYGADGRAKVDPVVVWSAKSWDDDLLRAVGDDRVSIESSPTMVGDIVYFANSGGLLQGWDLAPLWSGGVPSRTFRLWLGDDSDATVVADADGMLYVAVEVDRRTARGHELGQLLKIDPTNQEDPVVWSIDTRKNGESGSWATPALWGDLVIFTTKPGEVIAARQSDGSVAWRLKIAGGTISSPSVVDGVLLQGDGAGYMRAWRLDPVREPVAMWGIRLGGNIESTAATWAGQLYVGSRDGYFYKISTR
jgi:hypothetical protein